MGAPLNIHMQHLAYLREVTRCPTFTEAAKRLHISQPALSQALAELERRLGVTLFEKAGRARQLTAEGEEVAAFARTILSQGEDFERHLQLHRRGEGGVLRVGMIDAVALYVLPGVVRSFRRRYPEVELQLTVDTSAALLNGLETFDLEMAFVVGPVDAAISGERLLSEPMYIYAPRNNAGRPREAEWVLYPEESHTRALIDVGLARLDIVPHVTLESSNPQILRQMVVLGLGWTVLPAGVAERGPAPLERWRRRAVARRQLLSVRRESAPTDARVERFMEMVRLRS
ncbi:LysR family transcriptional regulator [Myxococcota bacterium]